MGELAIETSERTKRRKHCVMFNGEHMWVVCGEVWGCVIVYRASCVFEIYAVNPSRIKKKSVKVGYPIGYALYLSVWTIALAEALQSPNCKLNELKCVLSTS
jgi:hypothetical protein